MISVMKPRNRRQRVKNLLVPVLEEHIWPLLEPERFCWRRSLRFWRGDSSGRQALEFAFRLSRRRTDPVLAYLCPRITVRKPGLGKQVQKLLGEETTAKKNPEVLVHQSVGLVSPDRANTRWILFGEEDLTDLGPFLGEYVKTYVLPFLNRYRSCRDIVEGWESGDERLPLLRAVGSRWWRPVWRPDARNRRPRSCGQRCGEKPNCARNTASPSANWESIRRPDSGRSRKPSPGRRKSLMRHFLDGWKGKRDNPGDRIGDDKRCHGPHRIPRAWLPLSFAEIAPTQSPRCADPPPWRFPGCRRLAREAQAKDLSRSEPPGQCRKIPQKRRRFLNRPSIPFLPVGQSIQW